MPSGKRKLLAAGNENRKPPRPEPTMARIDMARVWRDRRNSSAINWPSKLGGKESCITPIKSGVVLGENTRPTSAWIYQKEKGTRRPAAKSEKVVTGSA